MKADDAKRLREPEWQNTRLKRIVSDKELEIDALRETQPETGEPAAAFAESWRCSRNGSGCPSGAHAESFARPLHPPPARPGLSVPI